MKRISFFVTSFIWLIPLFAENQFSINAGISISNFYDTKNSDATLNGLFGVYYNIEINNSFSILTGLEYTREGGVLKDRAIKTFELKHPEVFKQADVYAYDINALIGYLKLPFEIGYAFDLIEDQKTQIFLGASFYLPFNDHSNLTNETFVITYIVGETNYNFDYEFLDGESAFGGKSSNYSIDVIISHQIKSILFKLEYSYFTKEYGYVDYLSKNQNKLYALRLKLGYVM